MVCTPIQYIRTAMGMDAKLQMLQMHIIRGWPQNKDDLEPSLSGYWSIMHDVIMIDGVTIKGK